MKGEILCEGGTIGGEFSLLFLFFFYQSIKFSFLSHFNSWFLTIGPTCWIFEGELVLEMEEAQIWGKGELPAFVGEDPIGWIAKG